MFYKYHGLGNDFVLFDLIGQNNKPSKQWLKKYSNRKIGIGFDQALFVLSEEKGVFNCAVANADGSWVGQCGNGMRCIADYLMTKRQLNKVVLQTKQAKMLVEKTTDNLYVVNMGKIKKVSNAIAANNILTTPYGEFKAACWDIGNPHLTLLVDNMADKALFNSVGNWCQEQKDLFPAGVNVGFANIINEKSIFLSVFERGVGLTECCASGACCAVKALFAWQLLSGDFVKVNFNYGFLLISLLDNGEVTQAGEAACVFEGYLSNLNSF